MSIDKKFTDFLEAKSSAEIINPEKKVPNPKGGKPPAKTQFRKGNNAANNDNFNHVQGGEEEQAPVRKRPVVIKSSKKKPVNDDNPSKKEIEKVVDLKPKMAKIDEATNAPAVFTFGRMNPPTVGHEKLVAKVFGEAKKSRGTPYIYLSHTEGKATDPIPYRSKIKYARKAFGSAVTESRARTIIQILQEIQKKGHNAVTMVVGSDRVREFNTLINKYNGKDFTFESVNVVSAGQRDPDAEGVAGMSASKMRQLAKQEKLNEFKKGLPRKIQNMSKEIMSHIKEEYEIIEQADILFEEYFMNDADLEDISEQEIEEAIQLEMDFEYSEDEEQLDEVLSMQARRKRALRMRRMMPRIKRQRKLMKNRMATPEMLRRRALRAARTIIRRKVIGAKGADYSKLSTSMKIQLDKRVAQKQKVIQRIAKRLMPKVKQAEMKRLRNAKAGNKDKKVKKKTPSKIMTTNESIIQKAQENNIPVDQLFEQYLIGKQNPHGKQNPEQGGFARMAKFIEEEKMTGSEYRQQIAKVKSKDKGVHKAVTHILDKQKSKHTKHYKDHPDVKRAKSYMKVGEENKNCGCGQDPCITYGTQKETTVMSGDKKKKSMYMVKKDMEKAVNKANTKMSEEPDLVKKRLKDSHKDEKKRLKAAHTKELERLKMRRSRQKIRSTTRPQAEAVMHDVDMIIEALQLNERIEKEREAEYDVTLTKKLNQLLRMGLADKGELQTYQRALRGGSGSLKNPKLRKKLHQLLAKLLSIIEHDPATFIKIRAEVQQGKTKGELDPNRFVDS